MAMRDSNILGFLPNDGNDCVSSRHELAGVSPGMKCQGANIVILTAWTDEFVSLVAAYPAAALGMVFAAAIIEAVAVLGILIPGTPILMAIAGAAAMAGQPMLPFLALSIVGAVLGDFVSFWVGKRFATQLRTIWPLSKRPAADGWCLSFFPALWLLQHRIVPICARAAVDSAAHRRHGGYEAAALRDGECRLCLHLGAAHIYPSPNGRSVAWSPEGRRLAGVTRLGQSRLRRASRQGWPCTVPFARRRAPDYPPATPCVLTYKRVQAVAGRHEQPVAITASETQICAPLRQGDMTDRLPRLVEHPHPVQIRIAHAPAAPQVAIDIDAEPVRRAAGRHR